jgi:hypothetical protein
MVRQPRALEDDISGQGRREELSPEGVQRLVDEKLHMARFSKPSMYPRILRACARNKRTKILKRSLPNKNHANGGDARRLEDLPDNVIRYLSDTKMSIVPLIR